MENLLRPPVQAISDDVLFSPQKMVEPSQIPGYLGYPLVNIQKAMENHIFFIGKTMVFLWFIFHSTLLKYQSQWEIQDPKMEVLYNIRPYFVEIFPYISYTGLIYIYNIHTQSIFLRGR